MINEKITTIRETTDKSWQEIADEVNREFDTDFSSDAVRFRYNRYKDKIEEETPNYKEQHEILSDGSHRSDKLLRMSAEQKKDVNYILDAHGFDKDEWELVTARHNIWNTNDKVHGIQTLYASKVTVKPKEKTFDLERALSNVKPIKVKIPEFKINDKWLLEISMFDQHFGISDYEYYKPTQAKVHKRIASRVWEEILFTIGSDMLHNDGFTGQTTKGTIIEKVDMEQAWEEARMFYEPLIEESLQNSNKVKIIYSPGNHDESMSWCFVKYLKARFPQCEFDDKLVEHKIHVFGDSAIGITHGDKGRKDIHNVFMAQFPMEWGKAKNKEIHMGHFHVEDAKDKFGTMVRTLATRNKTDEWHRRNGYVGAHKRFMIFEYDTESLESIHYV